MDIVQFLESLANTAYAKKDILNILETLPADIKMAFNTNNSSILKNQISPHQFFADANAVVNLDENQISSYKYFPDCNRVTNI